MTKKALLILALSMPVTLGGGAALLGAGAGAAAVDYFLDDNNVCNGPNDAGLIDSDCRDGDPKR